VIVSRIRLKNWRNFRAADAKLRERVFVVGPNASGKSNFLDVFRFLRDVAKPEGGGLQKAVRERGGLSKLRCLAARKDPEILVSIELADAAEVDAKWIYTLGIKQQPRGDRLPYVSQEIVKRDGEIVLSRPDESDVKDEARLTQTYLEQISANSNFREIARFLETTTYLHLIPQLIRYADAFQGKRLEDDPFGQGFLEAIAKATDKTRESRLKRIEEALRIAVPQMQNLRFFRDPDTGRPHLEALYSHWRPNAGWQREDQFSDGTLRMIGFLWCLLERDSLLLLEEPELSLNAAIVRRIAPLIYRIQRIRKRQVIVSTHSDDLLMDKGIDASEVLILRPTSEGTEVQLAVQMVEVVQLLEGGMTVAEAVLPLTAPRNIESLSLFDPN
jgi:predicted ATPase